MKQPSKQHAKTINRTAAVLLLGVSLAGSPGIANAQSSQTLPVPAASQTQRWVPFVACGEPDYVIVPENAVSVTIEAVGGSGGSAGGINGGKGGKGGKGGYVNATFPVAAEGEVKPGSALKSIRGCNGEPNTSSNKVGSKGWSAGARGAWGGGAGGGSTGLWVTDEHAPLLVAGGGGGAGGGTCAGKNGYDGGAGGSGPVLENTSPTSEITPHPHKPDPNDRTNDPQWRATGQGRGASGADGSGSKNSGNNFDSGLGGTNNYSQGALQAPGTSNWYQGNQGSEGPIGGGGGGFVGGAGGWDGPARHWLTKFLNKVGINGVGVCSNGGAAGGGSSWVHHAASSSEFSTRGTSSLLVTFTLREETQPKEETKTTYEAEAADNTYLEGANWDCAHCSGGRRVGNVGVGGAPLTFTGVRASQSDTTKVEIAYTNGDTSARTATVQSAGTTQVVTFPPTGSWDTVGTVTVDLLMRPGASSRITLYNQTGWAPDIDAIRVG